MVVARLGSGLGLFVEADQGPSFAEKFAAVFLAGADDALRVRKRGGSGLRPVHTAVGSGGHHVAGVSSAKVVILWDASPSKKHNRSTRCLTNRWLIRRHSLSVA